MAPETGASILFGLDGLGRTFLVSSAVGFAITFMVTGGIALLAGAGWVPALGVGLFTGLWGGPGFGGMIGLVHLYDRSEH